MKTGQARLLLVSCALLGGAAGCLARPATASPTAALATAVQATEGALGLATQVQASPSSTRAVAPPSPGTSRPALTVTPVVAGLGSISGYLTYPSEAIPAERVVAFSTASAVFYFVDTVPGSVTYKISKVPSGTYAVVAYVAPSATAGFPVGLAAGYSQAVPCGLVYGCEDHSLLPVVVRAGQDTPQINPQDWYAPEGSFPRMPTP